MINEELNNEIGNEYDDEYIIHYGMPRRSGRYPWGSGKESYQRTGDFLSRIKEFKSQGMSEKDMATAFGLSTTQLRAQQSMAKNERRTEEYNKAANLRASGMSLTKIAVELGYPNESSVRSLLNQSSKAKMDEAGNFAKMLKDTIDAKGMIDVGAGVEKEFGISREKMEQALAMLEMQGYPTYSGGVDQVTNSGKRTTIKVICPPDTEHKEIYNYSKVNTITDYNTKTGESEVYKMSYPTSVDFSRIKVRYAEEGGVTKDGTIELRRGVPDLDLGGQHYSQVRILANDSHYLKGMAVYKDDSNFPKGVDIVFNTNKSIGTPIEKVLKAKKVDESDPTNPFGSTISAKGQSYYTDPKTGERKLSAINKRAHEGDWNDWADGLPSQFLAKQSDALIKKQLSLTKADKAAEFEEIMSITHPTIRKHYLDAYAKQCDADAVSLKVAALPRQKYQVILPIDSLKDNQVYAPNFKDGETVALVRFPHGGTFEIPILTVNNKNKDAINMISKNPKDAVCINSKVAERLSGADFDGDTVLVIPSTPKNRITSKPPLAQLANFDNKREYPYVEGMKVMTKGSVGREMGVISNLITDMTLGGATDSELARAVKHSMVVIDAHKHVLNYKKSEADNGIPALKKKYQIKYDSDGNMLSTHGASTLLSQAKGEIRIPKRQGTPKINLKDKPWYDASKPEGALIYNKVKDPATGKYVEREVRTYVDRKGKVQVSTETVEKMAYTSDARTLSSGTTKEAYYADYANHLKALANAARKEYATTPGATTNKEAKVKYRGEVASLKHKLNIAEMNAPKERQAQMLANSVIAKKKADNPSLTAPDNKAQLKKLKQHELEAARAKFGAKRQPIVITDSEWNAIQAGAVTENILSKIMLHADVDSLRSRATPKTTKTISPAKLAKAKAMRNSGHTNEEIAQSLGISVSALLKEMKGE